VDAPSASGRSGAVGLSGAAPGGGQPRALSAPAVRRLGPPSVSGKRRPTTPRGRKLPGLCHPEKQPLSNFLPQLFPCVVYYT